MSTLLEMRIDELEDQNAALAAQVEWFVKAFSELRDHHVSNFHLEKPFIGNWGFHENWRTITDAISAQGGILHSLIYNAWVDGFEASNCTFNGEYSDDEKLPYVLAKCFADGVSGEPAESYQHHLRQVRSAAVLDAVNEHEKKYGNSHFGRHLREYADSILAGKG